MHYRDFHDAPRMVVFRQGDARYLLDCSFDDAKDDYSDRYTVYRLNAGADETASDWRQLPHRATKIGAINVADVHFDNTKRALVDVSLLGKLQL